MATTRLLSRSALVRVRVPSAALALATCILAQSVQIAGQFPFLSELPGPTTLSAMYRDMPDAEAQARRAGVLSQLPAVVLALAASEGRSEAQLTAAERGVINRYRTAYTETWQQVLAAVGGDRTRLAALERYTTYEALLLSVLEQTCPPALVARYRAAAARRGGTATAPVQVVRSTPSTVPPPGNRLPRGSAGTEAEAYRAQANRYLGAEDYAQAIEAYRKAIALEPSDGGTYYRLAVPYFLLEQYPLAISVLKQAMTLREPDADDLIMLGSAHRFLKQYPEAVDAYGRAIRLKPNSETLAWAHENIGYAHIEAKQYAKAVPALREAFRLDPKNPRAITGLANVYFQLLQFPDAMAAYEQVIRLIPDDVPAHFNLGYIYGFMGRKEDALQVYRELQRIDKKRAQELYEEISKFKF